MSTNIIPAPTMIPIHTDDEPDKCPGCGKSEKIKQVCAHCGYEYKDDSETSSFLFIIIIIAAIGIPIWLMITFSQFVLSYSHPTLTEVIYYQWIWISEIFSRLW
jgi:hypothetical protein